MATDIPRCALHNCHPSECFLTHNPTANGPVHKLSRPNEDAPVEIVVPELVG